MAVHPQKIGLAGLENLAHGTRICSEKHVIYYRACSSNAAACPDIN
jgi:hypothetical protein